MLENVLTTVLCEYTKTYKGLITDGITHPWHNFKIFSVVVKTPIIQNFRTCLAEQVYKAD